MTRIEIEWDSWAYTSVTGPRWCTAKVTDYPLSKDARTYRGRATSELRAIKRALKAKRRAEKHRRKFHAHS